MPGGRLPPHISGQFEQALTDHDRAVKKGPDNDFVVAGRAVTRRMMDDYAGAVEDLEKEISLDPSLWALQGNLMIWDIRALDQGAEGINAAQAALADAAGEKEAELFPFSPLLTEMCADRQSQPQIPPTRTVPIAG